MTYSFDEAAALIIKAGKELVERGLIARTWGNISARISETEFLITPSGLSYDSLTPEKLVAVSIVDGSYSGDIRPSSERGVHAEAYKHRGDVDFIIHTHQTMATAVSTLGKDIVSFPEKYRAVIGEGIICGAYAMSSTPTLMRKMSRAIRNHKGANAFFMRYHGALCLGEDYEHAFAISEAMETICTEYVRQATGDKAFSVQGLIRAYEEKKGVRARTYRQDIETGELRCRLEEALSGQHILIADSDILRAKSRTGEALLPMIDDMAQIVGTRINNMANGADIPDIVTKLGKQNAILIEGMGAVCVAHTKEDAHAVAQVLEKNILCEMYATLANAMKPLGWLDARIQRRVYLESYSKQMSH